MKRTLNRITPEVFTSSDKTQLKWVEKAMPKPVTYRFKSLPPSSKLK